MKSLEEKPLMLTTILRFTSLLTKAKVEVVRKALSVAFGRTQATASSVHGPMLSPHSPQPIMAPLIGLALLKSCQFVWPNLKLSLKAPNDLFLMHKKVAGLLTESIQQGDKHRLIIGLGMNINDHPQGY